MAFKFRRQRSARHLKVRTLKVKYTTPYKNCLLKYTNLEEEKSFILHTQSSQVELILTLKIYLTANYTPRTVSTFVMLVKWKL